ncbi:MAG: EamA family transporter [Calothrix sp. MO_167.B42]|nr:EamA family transporter [Calothrix sp. MO_167.B42]
MVVDLSLDHQAFRLRQKTIVVSFSLDSIVLKRTSARTFGLLLSLEPAIASLMGWFILGEQLSVRSLTGVVLISVAAAGHSRFQSNCEYSTKPK